jgi:glutamyl-tRNA synthetase
MADLRWLGLDWQEGPDVGGPCGPYVQSERLPWFAVAWRRLQATGTLYPCDKSRQDVARALTAPHAEDDAEPIFPPNLRPAEGLGRELTAPGASNWRFRVPDGETIAFTDALCGPLAFVAGRDFGDFLVWRKDGFPAYELAVVADDQAMGITEVVRGADLLLSTARQLLLYRALGWTAPTWAHAPLIVDAQGRRLAKRSAGLSIRELRAAGRTPAEVLTAPLASL